MSCYLDPVPEFSQTVSHRLGNIYWCYLRNQKSGEMAIMTYTNTQVDQLTQRIISLYKEQHDGKRLIIGIVGIPGSGKSTLSAQLCNELNQHNYATINLPQDGFHLYRHELQSMENSDEAIWRRGAPFTFNAEKLVQLIKKLNDPHFRNQDIYAPSFDHKLKDPVENDIKISKEIQIIILEGNYLSLKDEVWNQISNYIDETWFLEIPLVLARHRLLKRHLEAGIVSSEEEALHRAENNDLVNGKYIIDHSIEPDVRIIIEE